MFGIRRWLRTKPIVQLPRSVLYPRTSTFKALRTIEAASQESASRTGGSASTRNWLMPYRADLRDIYAGYNPNCNEGEVAVIRWYMARCSIEMLPVCIWLVGKCADRFRLYGIPSYRHHPWTRVRLQVAKALRRSEAWTLLDEMARNNPDDARIRWYATASSTRRSFPERLSQFTESMDDSHADEVATPSRMPFWAMERSWDYSPPKNIAVIRRMLRRIRHWVRWGIN